MRNFNLELFEKEGGDGWDTDTWASCLLGPVSLFLLFIYFVFIHLFIYFVFIHFLIILCILYVYIFCIFGALVFHT